MVTGLRRSGASAGAAVAFFLGNPTLNPAVLAFLALTLGWRWAVLRLVLGLVLVFGVAALVARVVRQPTGDIEQLVTSAAEPRQPRRLAVNWLRSFVRLTLWLVPEYIVIVALLGAARGLLFPTVGPGLGDGVLIIVLFALVGTLFVIPTAGEIPIIMSMMSFGLGAGPAGALLLTLAPVSLPSLAMVSRVFPARALALLAAGTVAAGLAAGLLAVVLGF